MSYHQFPAFCLFCSAIQWEHYPSDNTSLKSDKAVVTYRHGVGTLIGSSEYVHRSLRCWWDSSVFWVWTKRNFLFLRQLYLRGIAAIKRLSWRWVVCLLALVNLAQISILQKISFGLDQTKAFFSVVSTNVVCWQAMDAQSPNLLSPSLTLTPL